MKVLAFNGSPRKEGNTYEALKVILIGESFGSLIISHYSARHPEKIEKIVFSSPGAFKPHLKTGNEYADLDSIYTAPDSLKFIEPYNYIKDVESYARKPKQTDHSRNCI